MGAFLNKRSRMIVVPHHPGGFGSSLVDAGQVGPIPDQFWSISADLGPTLPENGPNSTDIGSMLAVSGPSLLDPGLRILVEVARFRGKFG